jgi:hypothetical protein
MLDYFLKKVFRKGKNTLFLLIPFALQAQYSNRVESVLKKAGGNRIELEKALSYAENTHDPFKVKAMQFLIANMDIHFSSDYYWENQEHKKIDYNELSYADFEQAKKELTGIKEKNSGLHPKVMITNDIDTLTGDFLIQNLENAFKAWRSSAIKDISFENFCQYILPYRVSEEPLQDWRLVYQNKFKWIDHQIDSKGFKSVLYYVKDDYDSWFTNTWGEQRKEPLPRLGALQLLFRSEGPCPDIADLGVFIMRSQGIGAAINVIPFWATSTGGHFTNTFFGDNMQPFNCDYGSRDFGENLKREPAKVLRITYSKQAETLASFEDPVNIPKGFLQQQNYIDVTKDYWETTDVICPLFPMKDSPKIVYATTFNGLIWRPFWWGKVENASTTFNSICNKTVLLPQYYKDGKLIPAGAPIIVGDDKVQLLQPDFSNTKNVTIAEADKYLKFKIGVTYKLFYWNNGWKLVGEQEVKSQISTMLFANVPKNALLLFLGSDSKKLERPFTIDDAGKRTWF